MENEELKKIKSQKNTAIFLIVFPLLIIISKFSKTNAETSLINDTLIYGALFILIILGFISLKKSKKKQKELNKK